MDFVNNDCSFLDEKSLNIIYKRILKNPNYFFKLSSELQNNEVIQNFFIDNACVKKYSNFSDNKYFLYYKVLNLNLNDDLYVKAKNVCILNGLCCLNDKLDFLNKDLITTVDKSKKDGRMFYFKSYDMDNYFFVIKKLLDCLNSTDSYILKERFGINDGIPKTLLELSLKLNLSREWVRQIESRALSLLSKYYCVSKSYLMDKPNLDSNSLIFKLGLNERCTLYLCKVLKVFTINDLANLDDNSFFSIFEFSKASYNEIISKFSKLGIKKITNFDRLCELYKNGDISINEILDLPIEDFSFSLMTKNYLKKIGMSHVKYLLNMKNNANGSKYYGIKSYNEVMTKFEKLNKCKNIVKDLGSGKVFDSVLQVPIENLCLSSRTYNACKRNNINIIYDLISIDKDTFCNLSNVGINMYDEVAKKLLFFNIHFEMSNDELEKLSDNDDFFDNSISILNFTMRTYNCLINHGIYTVKDLVSKSVFDLYFDIKSNKYIRDEIVDVMKEKNLFFDMNVDDMNHYNSSYLGGQKKLKK